MSNGDFNTFLAIHDSMNRALKKLEDLQIPTSGSAVAVINRLTKIRENVVKNITSEIQTAKLRLNSEMARANARAEEKKFEIAEKKKLEEAKKKLEEAKKQLEEQKVRDDKELQDLRRIVAHLGKR